MAVYDLHQRKASHRVGKTLSLQCHTAINLSDCRGIYLLHLTLQSWYAVLLLLISQEILMQGIQQ